MSEYGNHGHFPDCGGSGGHHFNDCIYDGVGSSGGYSRGNSSDTWKTICLIMMVVFGGLCPPIGGCFFWPLCLVNKGIL